MALGCCHPWTAPCLVELPKFAHSFIVTLLNSLHLTGFNMSSTSCWDPKTARDSHPQF